MCDEMTKATSRRVKNKAFTETIFRGVGLDVGCGYDKMDCTHFPLVHNIDGYDQCLGNGNAQTLIDIPDNSYDFLVSSHCLEHMESPEDAIKNWIRVVKPSGYLVITVPDWDMYEHRQWPSKFNGDHKSSWTIEQPDMPHVRNIHFFLQELLDTVSILQVSVLTDKFDKILPKEVDQTGPVDGPECAIEFILRKK